MALVSDLQEKNGKVEIYLDGVLWLRLASKYFKLSPLEVGSDVESQRYLDQLAAHQTADCYEAALCLLDRSDYSSGDLLARLMRKGFVAAAAQATIARLIDSGLIDDSRYAHRMAQSQLNRSVGVYAVRRKLMAKRLSSEVVEEAMNCFDEEQQLAACCTTAEKLWRKYSSLPAREGRSKLSQALARRGFSWEDVHCAVEKICGDCSDDF